MTKDFQNGPNLKKNWLQLGGWGEPIVIKLKNSVVVVLKLWWVSESLGEVGKNRAQTLSCFNKPGAPVFFISSVGGCDTLQILKTTAICGWLKNKISYRWKKQIAKGPEEITFLNEAQTFKRRKIWVVKGYDKYREKFSHKSNWSPRWKEWRQGMLEKNYKKFQNW